MFDTLLPLFNPLKVVYKVNSNTITCVFKGSFSLKSLQGFYEAVKIGTD